MNVFLVDLSLRILQGKLVSSFARITGPALWGPSVCFWERSAVCLRLGW